MSIKQEIWWEDPLTKNLGIEKPIFYFDTCGEINTQKALELSLKRARELNIKKIVVASETGLSAIQAAEIFDKNIELIVVTSAAGTKIEGTAIGDQNIGIPNLEIKKRLENQGITIIRATDPLYNIGAQLEHQGTPTLGTYTRMILRMISSGTAVCIGVAMMATDNGILKDGEEVISIAGSWIGLDTAIVLRTSNSTNMFKKGSVQVHEIICKPRNPAHSWPVDQQDWVGDLEPYKTINILKSL